MAVGATVIGDLLVNGNAIVTGSLKPTVAGFGSSLLTDGPMKCHYQQVRGTAVVADTGRTIWVVGGSTATVKRISAVIDGAIATGGDRTVNVDLQKSTGGGAFATILSATIQFTSADTIRTVKAGSLSSTSLVAGDLLQIVVTVAGAAGNQAQGLTVMVDIQEAP